MQQPLLSIISLTKTYGDHVALNDVSLELYQGEIVSLLGVNGAGKTTLSSIIATLRPPTQGDILYNGVSIYKNIESYRRIIGFCPQKPNLNNYLTLRENLFFAGRYYGLSEEAIESRILDLAQKFSFKAFLDKKPDVLSGGYKQRFMLARSVIHHPKIVIMDEPTVALDPHIRKKMWDFIKQLKQEGICVLLTTHYLDEAEILSDRVCLLDKGKVRLIETPQYLMQFFQKGRLEDVFIHLMQEESA
jgi:ABC-2 type transport system ATP-binding protein